jgi:hypothetical protein
MLQGLPQLWLKLGQQMLVPMLIRVFWQLGLDAVQITHEGRDGLARLLVRLVIASGQGRRAGDGILKKIL